MKRNLFGMAAGVLAMSMTAAAAEPVFHLTFDEEKPGAEVCIDRMDAARVCKLNNPKRYSFAPGKVGNALVLDNARTPSAPKDDPNAGIEVPRFWNDDFVKAMSVEVWVKIAEDVNHRRSLMYILQCGGQYGPGFSLYYNSANFMFQSGTTGKAEDRVVVTAPVADLRGQWVHLAATYDGEKKLARLYVNGECVKEKSDFTITPPRNRKQPLVIGRTGNARAWCGCIDDFKIYQCVLTPSEILEHAKGEL